MEIKSKIETNIPIQENNTASVGSGNSRDRNSLSINSDFESYLQELDEKPKDETQAQAQALAQNAAQIIASKEKISEETKINKEPDKKEKISFKIDKLDDIKLMMQKRGISAHDKESKINLDNFKKEDITFLRTLLENPSITLNNLNSQNLQATFAVQNQNNQVSYKSFEVSKGLFNLMEYSFKSQKPVRLDFNGNSSVILKMNNDGKLIAEFISNDKAMEYVLKSSIPGLKDKLDSEGIAYEEISYKEKTKNNNNNRQNKGGNQ